MKKKIILAIVAVLSFCSFAAGLTACAKKEHEHNYEATVVAPTCTELGYTVHTCNECQHSYVDTYVVALGHSYTNYVSNGNATCTQDGTKTAVCDRDGCNERNTLTDEGTKLGHALGTPVWTWTGYESATATSTCANDASHVESVTATISSVVTTPATCMADGVRTYTATVTLGGETYTDEKSETLTKLGHSYGEPEWSWTDYTSATATFTCTNDGTHVETATATGEAITSAVTTPVTCTADGVRTYTATVTLGGVEYTNDKSETITKLGHSYTNYVSNNDATCTQDGTKTAVCDREGCNETHTVTVVDSKLGHDLTHHDAKAPTCTEIGWGEYDDCSRCEYTTYTEIPAKGHTPAAAVEENRVEATCTTDGHYESVVYCSVCNAEISREEKTLTKLGHSYGDPVWSWRDYIRATATFTCSHNKTHFVTETATGEAITSAVTTPATCTDDGEKTYTATVSFGGKTYTSTKDETLTMLGHSYGEPKWSWEGYTKAKITFTCSHDNSHVMTGTVTGGAITNEITTKPTCTEKGVRTYTAKITSGGKTYISTKDETLTELGHSYTAEWTWTGYTSATATLTCSRDNTLVTKTATGEAITSEITTPVTCTKDGERTYTATITVDGVEYKGTATESVAATGHTWADNVCTVCKSDAGGSKGLNMVLNTETNTYSLDGVGDCKDTKIVIPAIYNGKPVTAIGASAFNNCSDITSVTFGANSQLTSIGESAFNGCSRLNSITIPASVTSIGNSAFNGCNNLNSITIPASVTSIGASAFNGCSFITSVTFGENIQLTSIGESTFNGCRRLTSVAIPDSVESIGASAFNGCEGLQSLTFGENSKLKSIGENAFYGCSKLASVTIPASVESIGDNAFKECRSLTSVIISDSVTSIGKSAFYNCSGLTSVTFGENSKLKSIGNFAFYNCGGLTSITIPDGVTIIGNSAFNGCNNLNSVTIPASVTSIGEKAFNACTGLESVTFGANSQLTSIGNYAFQNCFKLTSITIPASVTSIGEYAFYECSKLTSLTITASVTSIGNYAFENCTALTEINYNATQCADLSSDNNVFSYAGQEGTGITVTIGANVKKIPAYLFYPYNASSYTPKITSVVFEEGSVCESIGNYVFYNCNSLTRITIPNSVTSIGNNAFEECSSLTSITIPASVTSIGNSAFEYCRGLTSVTFGDNSQLTSIGNSAFSVCVGLTSIIIPDSVKSIGESAFAYCNGLTKIYYGGTAVKWGEIDINSTGNDKLKGENIYCYSETEPTAEGNYWHYVDGEIVVWQVHFSAGLAYTLNADSAGYTVSGIGDCKDTEIVIPSACYDGLPVTAIGAQAFYECSSLTSITIPASVTSIGDEAFRVCRNLTSVTIPASVTSIGSFAFIGCSSLTSITIPASVKSIGDYAFRNTGLTSITIPDGVESIGANAFYDCSSLTSVTIPASVKSIGGDAFYNCTGLTEINFNVTQCDDLNNSNSVFYRAGQSGTGITVTIGANVKKIPAYLFCPSILIENAPKITSVVFEEDSVCESIGNYAFAYCSSLTSITIPASVTSIGVYAFYNCSSLTSITISASVTSIGDNAFQDCSGLTSITIPASVTSIGVNAFYNCSGLTSVYYGGTVEAWGSITKGSNNTALTSATIYYYSATEPTTVGNFWHYGANGEIEIWEPRSEGLSYSLNADSSGYTVSIGDCADTKIIIPAIHDGKPVIGVANGAFYKCSSLTSVTIPASVESIGNSAFYSCDKLTSITISDGVTSIGEKAFYNCRSLTSVTIPASVESIGNYAFDSCVNLTSITFGETSQLTSIGERAFNGCSKFTSITIPASVESIGNAAFVGCSSLTSITVDENNKSYKLIDGNLYTIDGKTLIKYGAGKTETSFEIPDGVTSIGDFAFLGSKSLTSVTIPDGVTSIGNQAFNNCSSLTSITIPASVTSIGEYAFYYCSKLTSVTIPASVKSIGKQAFDGCTALTSVYYKGTAEAWKGIKKNSGNDILTSEIIYYYSEAEPTAEGNFWHYVDGEIVVWKKQTV